MASLPGEFFCTVREFPVSLCDPRLLPRAKIGTQRGYKDRSARRQQARGPSTRMRSSSNHLFETFGFRAEAGPAFAPLRFWPIINVCPRLRGRVHPALRYL
jgi:hypothetical protein